MIFSERAEKQEALEKASGVTATLVPTETTAPTGTLIPTETPVPTATSAPTGIPEEDGTIVLPFVPVT